jgi:hypothetical protein
VSSTLPLANCSSADSCTPRQQPTFTICMGIVTGWLCAGGGGVIRYVCMGVGGYLLLGNVLAQQSDVLAAMNSHTGTLKIDVSIARFCVAVKVGCSYAMLSFVARNCIKDWCAPPVSQLRVGSLSMGFSQQARLVTGWLAGWLAG